MDLCFLRQIEFTDRNLSRLEGRRDQIRDQIRSSRSKLESLHAAVVHLEQALAVSQIVAQKTQEELEYRISEIVKMALESIFPEPYDFKIRFEIKRGKTEANLLFKRDGEEIDPMTASGGGVVDVAAFALRLSCFLITRPRPEPFVVLDEPFRFVSKGYMPAVAELLDELSRKLKIQFLMVTHEEDLRVGNVIEMGD